MNRFLTLALAAIAAGTLVTAEFADARRLGGGRSLGAQRSAPTQAQPQTPTSAAPAQGSASGAAANPVMPRQGTAQAPAGATQPGAAVAPARSGMSRWLGPVAGLAAGLGLAALATHLGIAEELLSLLMIVGLVLVAIVVVRMLLARRTPARTNLQYAGGVPASATPAPRGYATSVPPTAAEPIASPAASSAANPNVPSGFDA